MFNFCRQARLRRFRGMCGIEMNCAVTINNHEWLVGSAKEIPVQNFNVEETVTVFVVGNSEEWQLKNLWIFLKQTGTRPTDLLVFLITCFVPPKSNSSVKTICISADNDFSPLRTYIFIRRNLVIRNVNKYKNRLFAF